ncbi:uncharacterized protein LOC124198850 isoform X2 [Daphnia pulex]|uniref:uncharacterized protein LOC124198850 isoform X2 n=1 Tax=Daphnia pulex TaxID=6669 RepID=UPI001EE0B076|nr:uncharacterized protein LOC124198850 isoform X2 [Daphnia pulex]
MMRNNLALGTLLFVIGMSFSVDAFSFDNFIDPLLSMNEENGNLDLGEILSSETAHNAARLFLSYINSTTTISASYALVIILGISLALLALLGLAYMTASAIFTGTSVQSYYGKRSIPDGEGDLDFNWTRIVQILHEMDEHFRRLGAEKNDDDCRKRLICRLFEKNYDIKNESQRNLAKLTNELSGIYKSNKFVTEKLDFKPSYDSMRAYHEANDNGKFGDCSFFYPKCDNN